MTAPDRARLRERTKGWIPIEEWGPVCAGCGDEEYRIDGYCSCECRDHHDDDDVRLLLDALEEAEKERDAAQTAHGELFSTFTETEARLAEAEKALRRLASTEGFEGAGYAGGTSFPERELRARGQFAREALDRIGAGE